jgi:hypothetical protein
VPMPMLRVPNTMEPIHVNNMCQKPFCTSHRNYDPHSLLAKAHRHTASRTQLLPSGSNKKNRSEDTLQCHGSHLTAIVKHYLIHALAQEIWTPSRILTLFAAGREQYQELKAETNNVTAWRGKFGFPWRRSARTVPEECTPETDLPHPTSPGEIQPAMLCRSSVGSSHRLTCGTAGGAGIARTLQSIPYPKPATALLSPHPAPLATLAKGTGKPR